MTRLLLPVLFLLCSLPPLVFLAMHVPTGEIPDEVAHIIRVDSVRQGQLVGRRGERLDSLGRTVADSGVTAHHSLLLAGFSFTPGEKLERRRMGRDRLAQLEALPWGALPAFVSVPNTAVYAPIFYMPAALGMQMARRSGEGPWGAIVAARLFNVGAYAGLGLAALLVARRLQGVLFATLVLPMALWMAASCSQDGLVVAAAVLAVALLTRRTLAAWWGAAAAVALVILAKPLYLPLAGTIFLLLPGRGTSAGVRLAGALLAAAPGLAWYAFAQGQAGVPFTQGEPFRAGPNWIGDMGQLFTVVDPALQVKVLLANPSLLVTLPLDTLWADGGWLLWQTVGLLAIMDLFLPAGLYTLWFVAWGALIVGEALRGRREMAGPGWVAVLVLLCVLATVFAVFDGQYLSWTRTGWASVEGVQGRYFLPLLPFLGLAIPGVAVPGAGPVRWLARTPAMAAALAGAVILPGLVLGTYYLR